MLNTEKTHIVASLTENLQQKTKEAEEKGADAVEIRLDLYEGKIEDIKDLRLPVIVTNRTEWEGGDHKGSEEERIEQLKNALKYAEAVDIELEAENSHEEIVEKADEYDVAVIVSSHDFEKTPSVSEMVETLEKASEIGDVAKLAVKAESKSDSLDLLKATEKVNGVVSTMAIGGHGSYTRFVSALHGSKITYACLGEKTAPGQLKVEEVRKTFETLNIKVDN
jgi:3-dehydroquinate dehydratase-1